MSLIAPTERKHWRTRLIIAGMYLLVLVGAATMVYPFLLMLSGSVKSETDFEQFEIVPSYFFDDAILFRKFEQARYRHNAWRFQFSTMQDLELFEQIELPTAINSRRVADLAAFIAAGDYPPDLMAAAQASGAGVQPRTERMFKDALWQHFNGDLDAFNRAMGATVRRWDQVAMAATERISRSNAAAPSPLERFYRERFRPRLEPREFWPIHATGLYVQSLRAQYKRDIHSLNAQWGTQYASFFEILLPRTCPTHPEQARTWLKFVQEEIHPVHLRNPQELEPGGEPNRVVFDSFEFLYRDYLQAKYQTIDALNAAWTTAYSGFEFIPLNLLEYDAHLMQQHRGAVVWEFFTRNYKQAFTYLALRGRALWVTIWFCGLSVLLHMLVNPLAAYALSRYRFGLAHWVMLICVLTMAFPAEVGAIPRFLMLRELGMLNTIWALVLPGAAHGFSIFILKGFFDGLPPELYEAAILEGASESWMFRNVTLSLTKPILAVTAFGAFVSSYGSFMFALIVCPDERMWTISVWLYQFQQEVSEPVAFAALVLASLPVLLAFLLAQRYILRGIVLPTEK